MVDVIDITSSSEPGSPIRLEYAPKYRAKSALRSSKRTKQPVVFSQEIIDIASSEDELPKPVPVKRRKKNDGNGTRASSVQRTTRRTPDVVVALNVTKTKGRSPIPTNPYSFIISEEDERPTEFNEIPTSLLDPTISLPEPTVPHDPPELPEQAALASGSSSEPVIVTSRSGTPTDQVERSLLEPEVDVDPTSLYVSQVLHIVPDVDPDHLFGLIIQHIPDYKEQVVQAVIHILLEDKNYPKSHPKGKRKRDATSDSSSKAKIDYGSTDRSFSGGPGYIDAALDQLAIDFPSIPKPYLRMTLTQRTFYAPTHLHLLEERANGLPFPYQEKKSLTRPSNKGKGKAIDDEEFIMERTWLLDKLKEKMAEEDANLAEKLNEQECADGEGIECGCCFTDHPFDKMIQCPDAHLFCKECMLRYAENLLGSHDVNIVCMDQAGCKQLFPKSELVRFLTPKLLQLYEQVKQQKEIEMANIDGLEECPHCNFKCVIENPDEKLFRCGNEDECGAVTCRACKKPDHLPRSCKEVEEDKHLEGRHAIEEAMTRALMRNCPKCKKPFVKEMGCNKMTCPNCRTLSCYVCRSIVAGYEHFDQRAAMAAGPSRGGKKCPLYDAGSVETRHAEEVNEAAKQAMAEYKRDHPDAQEDKIQVELAKAPVPPPAPTYNHPQLPQLPYIQPPFIPQFDAQQQLQHALGAAHQALLNRVWNINHVQQPAPPVQQPIYQAPQPRGRGRNRRNWR